MSYFIRSIICLIVASVVFYSFLISSTLWLAYASHVDNLLLTDPSSKVDDSKSVLNAINGVLADIKCMGNIWGLIYQYVIMLVCLYIIYASIFVEIFIVFKSILICFRKAFLLNCRHQRYISCVILINIYICISIFSI